jgi:hypothetical protein
MEENGIYLFIDPVILDIVIYSYKSATTTH